MAYGICQQEFAYLPLLNNKDEDSDFFLAIESFGFKNAIIDGTDKDKEGEWRSTRNNELLTYFNWDQYQPNNNLGHEHFLRYAPERKRWDDIGGSDEENLICEKPGKIKFEKRFFRKICILPTI